MGKIVEKKYFNKDKTLYICCIGKLILGLFDKDDECLCTNLQKGYDFSKFDGNGKRYLVKQYVKRHFCLVYRVENNDVIIDEPETFHLPTMDNCIYYNLGEGLSDD